MKTSANVKRSIWICVVVTALCVRGSAASVASVDSNNAVVLYDQAFALLPERTEAEYLAIGDALRGADPNEVARGYLEKAREAIEVAEGATTVRACIWGIDNHISQSQRVLTLLSQVHQIALAIDVDARTHAVDGDCRAALEKALSLRRLARHFSEAGDIGYLGALAINGQAFSCLQYVLATTPLETDTLTWLQGQLSHVQGGPPSMGWTLELMFKDAVSFHEANPEHVSQWKADALALIEDEDIRTELALLTDAEILERARRSYERYLASVHRVLGSELPYVEQQAELQSLRTAFWTQLAPWDPIRLFFVATMRTDEVHNIYVRWDANFNALRAAVEIYLYKVETGSLPEMLPAHLPKDPFSGQDFEYEITQAGFILQCRQRQVGAGVIDPSGQGVLWEFEFQIWCNN